MSHTFAAIRPPPELRPVLPVSPSPPKGQVLSNVRFDSFSNERRWFIESDNRFQGTSQNICGFGTSTPESAALNTDFGFVRLHEGLYHRVSKDLYVGGGFLFDSHTNVRPSDASNLAWSASATPSTAR